MAINPLQFFDVGRQAGAVGSAAYGPNYAINKMLDRAEKLGLVNAQTQGALNIAQLKADVKPGAKPFYTYGDEGAPTYRGDVPVDAIVRSEGRGETSLDKLINASAAELLEGRKNAQPVPTDNTGLDVGALFQGIQSRLSDMGQGVQNYFGGKSVDTPLQGEPAPAPKVNPVDQQLADAIQELLSGE